MVNGCHAAIYPVMLGRDTTADTNGLLRFLWIVKLKTINTAILVDILDLST